MAANAKLEWVFFSKCLKFAVRPIKTVLFVGSHIIIPLKEKILIKNYISVELLVVLILGFYHFLIVGLK